MRVFFNYITRRLLVSALCSATQTALVGPGHAEMFFRHLPLQQRRQIVGASPLGDTFAVAERPGQLTGIGHPSRLPLLDTFAMATRRR